MKMTITLCVLTALLQGCAMEPMTPQQQAYIQRMTLENQRAANAQAAQPFYQIVQPPQMQQAAPMNAGVQAFWTGKSELAQSVTGASGFRCEYNYAGKVFWRMYAGSCPSSVQVQ